VPPQASWRSTSASRRPFVLASTMLYLVPIQNVIAPVNVLVCAACLVLMSFEAAFGICIGCKVYRLFNRQPVQLCPPTSTQVASMLRGVTIRAPGRGDAEVLVGRHPHALALRLPRCGSAGDFHLQASAPCRARP